MNTNLQPIEYQNQRILTTAQLATAYGTDERRISENFNYNKDHYTEGKHFYCLEGEAKRDFLSHTEITDSLKYASAVYLWTEKGAWLHAKSLNTDKAWEAYEKLVDDYFRLSSDAILKYQLPKTHSEALRMLADEVEHREALQLENAQQKQIIGELRPKASYYDTILQSKSTLPITVIAKDYGMSGKAMNALLHDLGVQYKMHDTWLLYQEHADMGYTQSKTHVIDDDRSALHTYWTQKGRLFLYDLLKNSKGILPLIERQGVAGSPQLHAVR